MTDTRGEMKERTEGVAGRSNAPIVPRPEYEEYWESWVQVKRTKMFPKAYGEEEVRQATAMLGPYERKLEWGADPCWCLDRAAFSTAWVSGARFHVTARMMQIRPNVPDAWCARMFGVETIKPQPYPKQLPHLRAQVTVTWPGNPKGHTKNMWFQQPADAMRIIEHADFARDEYPNFPRKTKITVEFSVDGSPCPPTITGTTG